MFQAAVLTKKNKIQIQNFEIPKLLRKDQVLVKIKYAGICRSQIMEYKGNRGRDKYLPHGLGHEAVGVVKNKGSEVKKVNIGDKVILSWIKGKGKDLGGFKLKNTKSKSINFGPISVFSSYALVNENRTFLKPKKMNYLEAVLYGCAVPTGAGIVLNELPKIRKNHKVCLIGTGGIGMMSLITLLKSQCKIFVIENNHKKKNFLKRFKVNLIQKKDNLKNYQNYFDYCVESSGSVKMIEEGLSLIKNNGIIVFASHPPKRHKIKLDPHELIKGKRIFGSWGGCCKPDRDINKIFNFFNCKNIFTKNSKIKKYKLKNISSAFNDVSNGNIHRAIIEF